MFMDHTLFDELGPMKARQTHDAGRLRRGGPEAGKKFISGPEAGRKYTPGPLAGGEGRRPCATRRRHDCLSPVRQPGVHAL